MRMYFVRMQEGAHHGKIRSESVRDPFGPISDQNSRSQKFQNLSGRRRRGGGPLAAVPSPAARRAPAAAATAAQIENMLSTININYWDLTLFE